ncbi:MAG: hypothetical protein E6R05_00650 [Candidatus Moraniibacteriota bacterium]|nr:MAG: hypothetical protein E6R05_00650 [Candidatus Moranbacteria bacterium]
MLASIAKWRKSTGFKSAVLMTIGNVGSTGVAAIAMIIFSRQLGPEQFGIFSVLFSLMLILSRIGDMGINIAVSRAIAQNHDRPNAIISYSQSGSYLKAMIMLVIIMLGLIASPYVTSNLLNLNLSYSPLVQLVIVLSTSVVIYEYMNSLLQARQRFGLSVATNTIQSLLKLVLALISLVVVVNLELITLSYMLLPLLGATVGLFAISLKELLPRYNPKITKSIVNVARWTSLSILAGALAENIDVLIVQNYLSTHDTGLYAAATRIATVASLIGWSLGTVLNMRVAQYKDKKNLDQYLKKGTMLALAALILTLAIILVTTPLVNLTIGTSYLSVVPALNILLISTAILTATTPFVALFYVFDYPRYFAISGILTALTLISADLILIPSFGLVGAGWARVITRSIVIIYTLSTAYSEYKKRYGKN